MIHWSNLKTDYKNADRARWRRDYCAWAGHDFDGCLGYGRNDGDEPCEICKECDAHNSNNWIEEVGE